MTEAELLDTVWQRPDEDEPRRVYADWLLERGDVRGEFIQLQCDPKRTAEKGERERALEREHGKKWSAPFAELGVNVVSFRRGFPDHLATSAEVFTAHGQKLLRLAPISRVGLLGHAAFRSLAPLYALPEFARITELSLASTPQGIEGARELADAPNARGLRHLSLWQTKLTGEALELVASSPHLTQLENLIVGGQQIGARGLAALARSKLRALKHVSFHECKLSGSDWAALEECPAFANVTTFLLSGNRLEDEGLLALSRSKELRSLTELELTRHGVGDAGAVALARWPGLESLHKLTLPDNLIGDDGATALANSSHLGALLSLDLSANQLRADGARALAESTELRSLQTLEVSGNHLGVEGVTAFVNGRGLPRLEHLRISQNEIYTGTYTEHSDWDGTVTGATADEEGSEATRKRFASKPHLIVS